MSDTALRAQADAMVDAILKEAGIERPPRRADTPPKVRPEKPAAVAEPEPVYLAPASEYPEFTCPHCWPSATYLAREQERTGKDPLALVGPWNVGEYGDNGQSGRISAKTWHWFWTEWSEPFDMLAPGMRGFFGKFEYGWTRKAHPCEASRFESVKIGCASCRDTITVTLRIVNYHDHGDVARALEGRGWTLGMEYGWSYHGGPAYHAFCPAHPDVVFPRRAA